MIINRKFGLKLYNAILKAKKISKLAFEEDEFLNWCHTLNVIAGLPYDVELLGKYDLDKYMVPTVFTDLVIPRKISFAEGIKWEDVRSKAYVEYMDNRANYGMVDCEILVPLSFNEITVAILGAVKKSDDTNTTQITTLNGEVTTANYLSKFADLSKGEDAMVASLTEEFIPVAIDDIRFLMKSKYYNQDLCVCLDSWIEDAINNLRK